MPHPNNLKQVFLNKWLVSLQSTTSLNTNMTFLERKKAVKTSADVAMAKARNGTTIWSRAIIAKSIKGHTGQVVPRKTVTNNHRTIYAKLRRKTRTMRKIGRKVSNKALLARSVAKRLVQKRTKVLRSLVPGGEFMEDDVLLIEEALDYVSFLQAQVDGMRFLVNCKLEN